MQNKQTDKPRFVGECRKLPLTDACEILDSKRIPITKSKRTAGPYPYYGANGVQDYVADYIFDDELVLLAEDGGHFDEGKQIAYRVSGKCWVNNHAHVLRPKKSINVDYLCFALRNYDTTSLVNGATRKKLTQSAMKKIQVPLRPLNEQLAVVGNLTSVDMRLENARDQLSKLDSLVKSRFVEMFGSCEASTAIEDACDVLSGFAFKSSCYVENGIRIIRIANVQKGYIEDKMPCYYPSNDKNASVAFALRKDDLLVSLTGNVGRVGVMTEDLLPAALNQRVACLRPKNANTIDMRYLFALLNRDEFEHAAIGSSSGSAQKNLSINWLKSCLIAVPPIELQSAFGLFVSQVNKPRFAIQQQIEKLETLKQSLMQEYFG